MMTEMEKQLTKIIEDLSRQLELAQEQVSEQSIIIKDLQKQIDLLQESVNYLTKKMYSPSSEKTRPGQISLFDEDPSFFMKQSQLKKKPTRK